jgi:arylsulfatase A-like enzyme
MESAETRQRYGLTQFGQSCLLARRLIEAQVRLVQVNWYRAPDEPTDRPCWDSHVDEANRLKNVLVPPTDNAFSALLDDLSERGMLDETLIVCMSEFGRSPKLNGSAGRDHWGSVFSVALAGGGIRGGTIHGASDELAAYPKSGRIAPEDLTATLLHCLGFSPETEFLDRQGRPHAISRGQVIQSILG